MNPVPRPEWGIDATPRGEAARMLSVTTKQVQSDRFTAIRELRRRFGGVILLKGAGTLICDDDYDVGICGGGNPGMASGGMGDVLTGVIAGRVGSGPETR